MDVNALSRIATLIGEPRRIKMLSVLLDGNGHTASELAMAAAVSPQTASSHLSKLLEGNLIVYERRGRQRFFRLTNRDVAAAIEALGALAGSETPPIPGLRFARTCYDHLAGVLSIAWRDQLLKTGALQVTRDEFILTKSGERLVRTIGIDVEPLRGLRRAFARGCLDWTERHHHIGGAVGAAMLTRFFEMGWIARVRGTRAVRVTHEGERGFEKRFGIRCAALRGSGN